MPSYADITVRPFTQMLANLDAWLDLAAEHAKKKSFDPSVYLTARLAPDQFCLIQQIQAACDQAKSAAARLAGKEPPKHPDTEKTWDEIRARIKTVRDYLATVKPADLDGADSRTIPLPWAPGKGMAAPDYVRELAVANFYFHAAHAYAILRHNGVPLGKTSYIGSITMKDL